MLKKGKTKFLRDFLVPSLNSEVFGNQLKWMDKENCIFQLSWCHKGVPDWSEVEAQVFVKWDKMKGHYQPDEKNYFTNSKQRFRALLNKLTLEGQLKKIKSDMKFKKVYSITGVRIKKLRKRIRSSKAATDGSSANNESEDADGDERNKLCNASDAWADVAFGRTRDQLELTERARLAVGDFLSSQVDNCLHDHNYCLRPTVDSAKKHRKEHREEIHITIPTPDTFGDTSAVPEQSSSPVTIGDKSAVPEPSSSPVTIGDKSAVPEQSCSPVTISRTSAVPEQSSDEESDSSSSSPECCVTYDDFDETDLELSYEYYKALNANCEQRMQDKDLFKSAIQTLRIKVEEDGG